MEIFKKDGDQETVIDTIEHVDLMIIPYIDPNQSWIKYNKGNLVSLLQRRKDKGLSTITDLYISKLKHTKQTYIDESKKLIDSLGIIGHEIFTDPSSKYVGVRLPVGEKK